MDADDECGAVFHGIDDAIQGLRLEPVVEVGEDEIAAEHEVEAALRHCLADVLLEECDVAAEGGIQAVAAVFSRERTSAQTLGQLLQATESVASLFRTLEHPRIAVRGDDLELHSRKAWLDFRLPQDGE